VSESSLLCSSTVSTDTILVRAKSDDNLGVNDLNKYCNCVSIVVNALSMHMHEQIGTYKYGIPL